MPAPEEEGRRASLGGRLARLGVQDVPRAERILEGPAMRLLLEEAGAEEVLADLGAAADPDQALLLLSRWLEGIEAAHSARTVAVLAADEDARCRLIDVLGLSAALGEYLVRHPQRWQGLVDAESLAVAPAGMRGALLESVGARPTDPEPVASRVDAMDALRVAYREQLLGIATRDLAGLAPMEHVAVWLSDLADAALEAALAIARAGLDADAVPCRLAVIGMGKCGGRELNYVSDVDVIFVAESLDPEHPDEPAAMRTATALAAAMMRACSAVTAEGSIWEVDAALRPEGKAGALVRTLASHVSYYEKWAKTWEFQALLKARYCAGDAELGARYIDAVAPLVWGAAARPDFVSDVQSMRRRVEEHVPAQVAERELKLGPGGLRDVEFSVQLLQLVHGRSDVMLRSANTLTALEALVTWGYVGRDDAATLADAYRFLRTLEHRLQLRQLRRTHLMPAEEGELRVLGRSLGYRADSIGELNLQWRRHAREVRRLHEKLFYRPLLQSVARLDAGQARLTPEAAEARLQALGYTDPAGALRHLQALTSGVSRRAAIQRTLLPVLLGWFADAPDPDAGLLGFRQVSDALGSTHWFLGLLRDESLAAERLARILASSRYATGLLLRAPDAVAMLADDAELRPRTLASLLQEASAAIERHDDPAVAVGAVRSLRRRELLRVASAELLGLADAGGSPLSDIAAATVEGGLRAARAAVARSMGRLPEDDLGISFAVIGMGRFGGGELGFGSDADVMFVYEPREGAAEQEANSAAFAIANELRALLMAPSADPPLEIDADLRPEGRQGPLVRSLASYAAYYERWSSPWEAQALLRARYVAGDEHLGRRLEALIDPLRYPVEGLPAEHVREIRRLKARMESERLPRGVDPTLHLKLGRGGLSDVEWVVQLLQLQHGHAVPGLRTSRTLPALHAARDAQLLSAEDAGELQAAWLLATRVRDAIMLVRGRPSDLMPSDVRELAALAFVLGYPLGQGGRLLEDYRRTTRRARSVMERVFYES